MEIRMVNYIVESHVVSFTTGVSQWLYGKVAVPTACAWRVLLSATLMTAGGFL